MSGVRCARRARLALLVPALWGENGRGQTRKLSHQHQLDRIPWCHDLARVAE